MLYMVHACFTHGVYTYGKIPKRFKSKGLKLRDTESVHCLYHSEVAYNANHWPGDWWPVSMKIHTSHLWTFSWPDQAASYREPCWPCAMFSPAMPWQSPCTVRISYMCVHLFMYSVIYIYIYTWYYRCVKHIYIRYVYIQYILAVPPCRTLELCYQVSARPSCPSGLPEWSQLPQIVFENRAYHGIPSMYRHLQYWSVL